jgi:hypothetical protein
MAAAAPGDISAEAGAGATATETIIAKAKGATLLNIREACRKSCIRVGLTCPLLLNGRLNPRLCTGM